MKPQEERSADWNPDVARVSQEIAARLQTRGIAVHESDSPDDIVELLERVEAFEEAVEAGGGDLMMDEPPTDGKAQPDNPRFLLPRRGDDESAAGYLVRLNSAIEGARGAS
jgi:hypothetical protein